MPAILEHDSYKYLALAVLLLAILFAYLKGRGAVSAGSRSLAWTHVPVIAFAIASLGPSALAIMIYLGYKIGLIPADPRGYHFSSYISDLPVDFAVMNWPFVALYMTCRLWPDFGSARPAMWLSVAAMSLPNVLLFMLAPTMVADVYDAGQGIGIVQVMLMVPVIGMLWPGPDPGFFDTKFGILSAVGALTAPIPLFGLTGWLAGQFAGRADSRRKTTVQP